MELEARLETMLSDARVKFDPWKDGHMGKVTTLQEDCTKDSEVSEAKIRELYKQEAGLVKQTKDLTQKQGVQAEKLIDVDHDIAGLNTQLQELMSVSLTTEHKIAQEETMIAEEKTKIARYKKECEQYRLEKELGQITYENRLGLRFERVEDDFLRVVFTHIDPADLTKEFSVVVCVDSENVYQIPDGSCKPDLPTLNDMLEQLRTSNDFPGFVRQMRCQFVESATTVA